MRRTAVVITSVVLAGLALSACAGAGAPRERLAAAAEATTAADTAQVAVTMATQMGGDGARMDMTIVGEGEMDFAAEQAAMRFEMPGMGMDDSVRTVMDGDVVYTETSVMSATPDGVDDGPTWTRQEGTGGGVEMLFGPAASGGAPNALTMLDTLGAVEGTIEHLGADEVRDTSVEGYAFTAFGESLIGDMEDLPAELADLEVAMEAWLDADNRVRKLTSTFDLAELVAADKEASEHVGDIEGTLTVTLELFDFGTDVDIVIPAEDEVRDFGSMGPGMVEDVEMHSESDVHIEERMDELDPEAPEGLDSEPGSFGTRSDSGAASGTTAPAEPAPAEPAPAAEPPTAESAPTPNEDDEEPEGD